MKNAKPLINSEFYPTMLLAIYKNDNDQEFYIESHPIGKEGVVLEGKPLTHETVDKLLQKFDCSKPEDIKPSGPIPQGMLFADNEKEKYVWINEPEKRQLLFTDGLKIPDGVAMMPKLCFHVVGSTLSVYAMKKNDQLFRAPFHNVDSKGTVCQGSAKANKVTLTFSDVINYWEKIFFGSKFSHVNGGDPINGNIDEMWREMIKTGNKFDNTKLVKIDMKLKNLLYPLR